MKMPKGAMSPGTKRAGVREWMHAARPPTLPAAVVPVVVGTALAQSQHHFMLVPFLATLLAALLIQIGTNFANDYADFTKGADTAARIGPARITGSGLVQPEIMKRAAIVSFGASCALGVYLITVGGWPILIIGLASVVAGAGYTVGRLAFGYYGLGDIVCFTFFGLIAVMGTYYVQSGSVSQASLLASIPVGCLVTAILVVNNVRDMDTDRIARKRTLAVMIGRRATRTEYVLLVLGAYLWLPLLAIAGASPWWLFWLPVATVPLAISLIKVVTGRVDGRSLNVALKGTGRLHLYFGALLALSLLR
jgi:1,4-dihydroxy-2-naphthoate octaprenyltransferase